MIIIFCPFSRDVSHILSDKLIKLVSSGFLCTERKRQYIHFGDSSISQKGRSAYKAESYVHPNRSCSSMIIAQDLLASTTLFHKLKTNYLYPTRFHFTSSGSEAGGGGGSWGREP